MKLEDESKETKETNLLKLKFELCQSMVEGGATVIIILWIVWLKIEKECDREEKRKE